VSEQPQPASLTLQLMVNNRLAVALTGKPRSRAKQTRCWVTLFLHAFRRKVHILSLKSSDFSTCSLSQAKIVGRRLGRQRHADSRKRRKSW
jgi:hypothetical protein